MTHTAVFLCSLTYAALLKRHWPNTNTPRPSAPPFADVPESYGKTADELNCYLSKGMLVKLSLVLAVSHEWMQTRWRR